MDIYVGNLATDTTEGELKELFSSRGEVASVKIIKDRETGESRGFGFVEMPSISDANTAISALNGYDFKGNKLNIREARPKTFKSDTARPPRGNYGGNYGGNNYGSTSEPRKKFFGNDRPKKRFDRGNSYGE
jgi:RNA recognition motif-containing protein